MNGHPEGHQQSIDVGTCCMEGRFPSGNGGIVRRTVRPSLIQGCLNYFCSIMLKWNHEIRKLSMYLPADLAFEPSELIPVYGAILVDYVAELRIPNL